MPILVATSARSSGLLSEITELTGGRAFTIENPNDLADVATKIGIELRNQYVLGYRPKNVVRDGKWRKIKVKLMPPKGLPPLKVNARRGYYAPAEEAGRTSFSSSPVCDLGGNAGRRSGTGT